MLEEESLLRERPLLRAFALLGLLNVPKTAPPQACYETPSVPPYATSGACLCGIGRGGRVGRAAQEAPHNEQAPQACSRGQHRAEVGCCLRGIARKVFDDGLGLGLTEGYSEHLGMEAIRESAACLT